MSTRAALSKHKKDANINPKKNNRVFPRELFKFKYLRFKCRDSVRTIDFYKSCGMNLDFDGDLISFKHASHQKDIAGKPVTATMESNHLKKTDDSNEDGEETKKPEEDLGGPLGRVFGLSYPPTVGGVAALLNRVQLVFEEDKEFIIDSKFKAEKEKRNESSDADQPAAKKSEKKNLRQYEYLVIYVHSISRLVKRLSSKGFDITLDITQFDNNIKMAMARDPNKIEVRLIEMPDGYMNEGSHQKQWFARLGYYTIPTSLADKTVLMYESLFQVRAPKPSLPQKAKDAASAAERIEAPVITNIRKVGPAQMVKLAMTKGSGFRIVDMDEMVVGLMNSVFFWMGNDMRTGNCCLCFTEVSNADTGEAVTTYDKECSPLVAIGFEVPNLDTVCAKLKYETKDTLSWDSFRYRMSKSGIYARFLDSINGIKLDLLCSKLEPTIVTGKGKDRLNNNGKTAPLRKVEDNTKEDSPYTIDLNHLKGHARVLSEGCIKFVRGYGWELIRKDGPTSAGDDSKLKKDKDKKLLSLVRDEQEGNQMGSAEDLTPAPRKIKQSTRYKDAEVQALENFLNREKSKSV